MSAKLPIVEPIPGPGLPQPEIQEPPPAPVEVPELGINPPQAPGRYAALPQAVAIFARKGSDFT